MRLPIALVLLVSLAPAAAACNGLSPGDHIVSDGASCTLAFLVANKDGLYFATAGHCVQEGASVASDEFGAFGVGAFRHLEPDTGQVTDGSPGEDFGLIRIDPARYADLNPAVCEWGGPTGLVEGDDADGGFVRHYGYGLIFGDLPPTRAREGALLDNVDDFAFYWIGAGLPGDSGSAVIAADGRAIGVLTHLQVAVDTNGGTHLKRGFALAEEAGFAPLRLVLEGEDPVAVLASLQGAPATPDDDGEPTQPTTETPASPTPTTTPPSQQPSGNDTTQGNASADDDPVAPAQDDGSVPAATEGGNETPAPGIALVLAALALVAIRRRGSR